MVIKTVLRLKSKLSQEAVFNTKLLNLEWNTTKAFFLLVIQPSNLSEWSMDVISCLLTTAYLIRTVLAVFDAVALWVHLRDTLAIGTFIGCRRATFIYKSKTRQRTDFRVIKPFSNPQHCTLGSSTVNIEISSRTHMLLCSWARHCGLCSRWLRHTQTIWADIFCWNTCGNIYLLRRTQTLSRHMTI